MKARHRIRLFDSARGGIVKSALGLLFFGTAAGALGWMLLAPKALKVEVEARTGFKVNVGSLSSNPMGITLQARDIEIENPSSYGGGGAMLVIRSLDGQASVAALGRGEIWVEDLTIDIARASLVWDERGQLNLETFLDRLFVDEDSGPIPFHAERVRFTIDEIEYVDYSRPMPTKRSIRPLLNQELRNVEDAFAIFAPVLELGERVGRLP